MLIEVTQADIDNGTPCNESECAIALAIRRQYRHCKSVLVTREKIRIWRQSEGPDVMGTGFTTEDLFDWICRFDDGHTMGLMKFHIDVSELDQGKQDHCYIRISHLADSEEGESAEKSLDNTTRDE